MSFSTKKVEPEASPDQKFSIRTRIAVSNFEWYRNLKDSQKKYEELKITSKLPFKINVNKRKMSTVSSKLQGLKIGGKNRKIYHGN